MTATERKLADAVRVTGTAQDVQRWRDRGIIKKHIKAERAKTGSLVAKLIADKLDEILGEI